MVTAREMMSRDVPLTSLTNEQLRVRVAVAQLYVVEMTTVSGKKPSQDDLRSHLLYFAQLNSAGRLFAFGPVQSTDGTMLREMAIVAAASREEAELIAGREPLSVAGLSTNLVRSHTMNEGVACYVGRALSQRARTRVESFDAQIRNGPPYDELVARSEGAVVQAVFINPGEKPRPQDWTGREHFVWLRTLEMDAKLLSMGPLESLEPVEAGIWGGGLSVLATSRQEAEHLIENEPSCREGYRTLSLQSWRIDYGLAAPIAKVLLSLNSLAG